MNNNTQPEFNGEGFTYPYCRGKRVARLDVTIKEILKDVHNRRGTEGTSANDLLIAHAAKLANAGYVESVPNLFNVGLLGDTVVVEQVTVTGEQQ